MPDRRLAWFHCFSGVAGDMALGALVDAGADLAAVEDVVRAVDVDGWEIEAEPVLRSGVAATKVHVRGVEGEHHHRTWRTVRALLDEADLPDRVHQRATATFALLARAEGALHRTEPDDVTFHEVGAIDALVDVVGTCAALEVLGVDEVRCSPVALGRGRVWAAHGHLPNPAPAVLRVLAEVGAPVHGIDTPVELTTPTGAALMAALASGFGPLPDLCVEASGYGAGTADPDGVVNATQVVLGTAPAGATIGGDGGQPVVTVETTVDDATGEVLGATVPALLAAGALDAWITPVVGKKGRPAHVVSALADAGAAPAVAEALRTATGSLGVRATTHARWPAARAFAAVEVDGHPVRIKVSPVRAKAEHDDVAAVAAATGRSVPEVAARAEAAWWAAQP
ncbi:nickel pincer cofactor biosynthesis protein LarC [Iamia sp. SCSIO 61187]|uniref:nickel pincer cofactor biosynthesis protein LarC n=1 Tax=Iamia sp. SCSIO 61187 TaxID=2722752 RepID=UPI001C62F34B|nr:nickel pincer cofactor biosynthesis protein LarC [Iamia sp. SCSIO 61187]QYG93644.1 nickel pincer cofactor biosynthesis protein LarC [Iamia sp. SCSIO 61187]